MSYCNPHIAYDSRKLILIFDVLYIMRGLVITSQQMRAARALLGIDQRQMAELAGLSLPTIQRMESSEGQVRGVVDTLVKVIRALEGSGIELIGENAPSSGSGRGVRLAGTRPGIFYGPVPSMLFDRVRAEESPNGAA
jgi:transcriptional regulator with XRE-family HTH domain